MKEPAKARRLAGAPTVRANALCVLFREAPQQRVRTRTRVKAKKEKEKKERNKRGELKAAKDALEGADEGKGDVRDVDDSDGKDAAHAVDARNALLSLGLAEGVREQVRPVHVATRAKHCPCAVRDSKKERGAEHDRNKERNVLLDGQLLHAVEEDYGKEKKQREDERVCAGARERKG